MLVVPLFRFMSTRLPAWRTATMICVTCQFRGVKKLWETCGQTVLPHRLAPPFSQ